MFKNIRDWVLKKLRGYDPYHRCWVRGPERYFGTLDILHVLYQPKTNKFKPMYRVNDTIAQYSMKIILKTDKYRWEDKDLFPRMRVYE